MEKHKLELLCSLNMGQSPESSSYNNDGVGLPFFQGNADFGAKYPNVRVWCSAPTKVAQAGDILISVRAPIGALNIADRECCIGRGLAAITVDENVLSRDYLWYALSSKVAELNAKGTGSTFKAISKSILAETIIPVPSFTEQCRITAKFQAIDNMISCRKQQLTTLDTLIKARFVEMFGDCETNPKQWKTLRLDEVADVGSSKRVFAEDLKNEGVPFYRGTEVGALAEGKSITPELFITPNHYKELCEATGAPQVGDLLMPSICPDGRIWVVNTDMPFYFKDGRVLWVHNIHNTLNPIFLLYTLRDRIMTDYLSIASGTTFAELKIFSLKTCQVFDVPIGLQNKFAAFIAQIDKSKAAIQKSLDELQTLFDSLMQEYFG